MDIETKEKFMRLWKKYFHNAELPITLYYTDRGDCAGLVEPTPAHQCVIRDIVKVGNGRSFCYDVDSVGCFGGKRYLGFAPDVTPEFEDFFTYFLSCGILGQFHGERYKKSPELVKEWLKHWPVFKAPARFIVFKRWDRLEELDNPEVVIFFATPDVLAGLFTLANFDEAEPNGVFAPFCAGCASVVQYPYLEGKSQHPRGIIGMFDVSARLYVPGDMLTFSVPMTKFARILDSMEESFLTTDSWKRLQKRLHYSER